MADLTTILGTDKFPPIFDALTSHLSIRNIIALTRTCRTLQPLYQKMVSNGAWDINNRLKKFVKDPLGFRKRLAELDGIISGGFALQFLDRVDWEGSDLDVCVQMGEKADVFCRYIEEVEGYDLASRKVGKYAWTHVDMISFVIVTVSGSVLKLVIGSSVRQDSQWRVHQAGNYLDCQASHPLYAFDLHDCIGQCHHWQSCVLRVSQCYVHEASDIPYPYPRLLQRRHTYAKVQGQRLGVYPEGPQAEAGDW
jgi:hypothetical protein